MSQVEHFRRTKALERAVEALTERIAELERRLADAKPAEKEPQAIRTLHMPKK